MECSGLTKARPGGTRCQGTTGGGDCRAGTVGQTKVTPNSHKVHREELIEQSYFFRTLRERLDLNMPMQEVLTSVRDEILSTTSLPLAIDYMRSELVHSGQMSRAMSQLAHYFRPFQTYVIAQSEDDHGRFDFRVGLQILEREADYMAGEPSEAGVFLYGFEVLCRHRLPYDAGLAAIAEDPFFDKYWCTWILTVRRQIGIVELSDMIYVRSQHYLDLAQREGRHVEAPEAILFGEREGRIALANRHKDPLLLFAAMHRQLGYPAIPRQEPVSHEKKDISQLARRLEQLESRLRLVEDEQKGGIDLTQFYERPDG